MLKKENQYLVGCAAILFGILITFLAAVTIVWSNANSMWNNYLEHKYPGPTPVVIERKV